MLDSLDRLPQPRQLYHRLRKSQPLAQAVGQSEAEYVAKIKQEQQNYADMVNVHDLPEIFHYWSNKYLLPMCQVFGFSHPDEHFANHLERAMPVSGAARFVSVGAGNCDTEVRIAAMLKTRGHSRFTIECLDINEDMLARGRQMAVEQGLDKQVIPKVADFNRWRPVGSFHAVMASQSLHHVMDLEHLFDAIATAIGPTGSFVISDVIGRNGHQRWPEALEVVREFWKELPASHRRNLQLSRDEPEFLDWDCSTSGFEGIRAQDILPLLVERFQFHTFLPFCQCDRPVY